MLRIMVVPQELRSPIFRQDFNGRMLAQHLARAADMVHMQRE